LRLAQLMFVQRKDTRGKELEHKLTTVEKNAILQTVSVLRSTLEKNFFFQ